MKVRREAKRREVEMEGGTNEQRKGGRDKKRGREEGRMEDTLCVLSPRFLPTGTPGVTSCVS